MDDIQPRYETMRELEFVRNIGNYSLHTKRIPRAEMLKRYLAGCQKRTDWLSIDREEVIAFAKAEMGG